MESSPGGSSASQPREFPGFSPRASGVPPRGAGGAGAVLTAQAAGRSHRSLLHPSATAKVQAGLPRLQASPTSRLRSSRYYGAAGARPQAPSWGYRGAGLHALCTLVHRVGMRVGAEKERTRASGVGSRSAGRKARVQGLRGCAPRRSAAMSFRVSGLSAVPKMHSPGCSLASSYLCRRHTARGLNCQQERAIGVF